MTGAADPHDPSRGDGGSDRDVVIVGGGPAGCSAAIYTARYGLDTVVFDRGTSSLRRCAHLENYLGFPAGIDVETFSALMHDQVEAAGCEVVAEMVESVEQDGDGFVVVTQSGRHVTARHVVAATRYDGEYLRSLDDDLFVVHEHDGEREEHFDRSYPGRDGRTTIEGFYVASPSDEADRQAIVAAGRGARVGLALLGDVRRERGYPESLATHYDWVRREAELPDEWRDREQWVEWFDDRLPEEPDLDGDRLDDLRRREIDRRVAAYRSDDEIRRRRERGQRRLVEHVEDDLVLAAAAEIGRETTGGSD